MNILSAWFCEEERKKSEIISHFYAEVEGYFDLKLEEKTFRYKATADRIEVYKDNSISIIDFKTGKTPKKNDVTNLKKPQLLVEGMIAKYGKFFSNNHDIDFSNYKIKDFIYYNLKNSAEGFSKIIINDADENLVATTFDEAKNLANQLVDINTSYLSFPNGKNKNDYSDYLHLARII
jgi:ATP-dependent helicase/nuclease subunit B